MFFVLEGSSILNRIIRLRMPALLILGFLVCLKAGLCSQATGNGGTIQGTIKDPSGALVAGAEVTISNPVSGYTQAAKSGSDGAFRLTNIPPNQYHLQITLAGFQT